MSYILDALKKLEHEKSRKARSSGVINIAGTLFEDDHPRPLPIAGRTIAFAVIAAVLVTFAVTWLLLRPGTVSKVRTPAPPAATSPPLPAAVVPAPPATPLRSDTPPPVAVTPPKQQPALPAAARPAPVKPLPSPAQPAAAPTAAVAEDAAAQLTVQELRKRMKERTGGAPPAEQMAAPADIKLSGIAWQDERRSRRAVVNGFLMQEGGVVSGARITDIFQDRVRFSLSGKVFEVPLISSGAPVAGR